MCTGIRRGRIAFALVMVLTAAAVRAELLDNACITILTRLELQRVQLQRGVARLHSLQRVAAQQERTRIERFLTEASLRMEGMIAEHEDIAWRFRETSCDAECALRLCRTYRDALQRVSERLDQELVTYRTFEAELRERLARAGRVRQAISATDRMVLRGARVARRTAESDRQEMLGALRRAFEIQEDAKQALIAGRYEGALKLTLKARDIVGEVVRDALDAEDVAMVKERARRQCEETRRMVQGARGSRRDVDNPRAAKVFEMAVGEIERACEQVDDQPYRALRTIAKARGTVSRLLRFDQRAGRLEERLERLAAWIEKAEHIVDESGNEKAENILGKGVKHYEQAKASADEGNVDGATAQLDIAVKLVTKATDIARGDTSLRKMLLGELRKTEAIVGRANLVARTNEQKERVEQARALLRRASEQFENPKACTALLDNATDIAFAVIAAGEADEKPDEGDD